MTRLPSNREAKILLDSLLYRIHAATDRDAEWTDVLALLRDWLGGCSASLGRHHFSSGQGGTIYDSPQDAGLRTAYAEYASRNPWFLSSDEYIAGRVMTGEELLGNRDLVKTDFYRGLLKPHGLFHRLCGVAARRGDLVYYVSVHRSEDQQGFGEREKSNLRSVLSHLSLALENRWSHLQAIDLSRALMGIVDRHPHATFLADQDGRVLYRNRSAGEFCATDAGLRMEGERLAAATAVDSKALREAIKEVARGTAQGMEEASRVLSISVPGDAHSAVLSIHSAGKVFLAEKGDSVAVVILTARNSRSVHDPHFCSFARQFELSPAQARVSALIFTGHSLASTAHLLHVSENTARSHLKQIFQKTNTHGQMELVHLHSRICVDNG
jgi:DNA-binding CsgD family transcriptional regulator/PAS domain-containing protein